MKNLKSVKKTVKNVAMISFAKKGRKVDPTSKRQIRLAELASKRANGTLVKGRPINVNSKRQQRMLTKAVNDMVYEIELDVIG